MSVLTAIFQAIGQAIAWVFPISESGHSAIFHNFSGRFTNACSQLTGVVHIGIAIGLFIAFFKLFTMLFKNFIGGWKDLFQKKLDLKNSKSSRKFMYYTVLSFVPMLLYLIPAGKYGNIYSVFHRVSYNENLVGEGICMLLTGALIIVTCSVMDKKLNPVPGILQAVIIGVIVFLAVPTAGCSVMGAVFCVSIILGMNEKNALRYSVVMSVMILLMMGIVELCTAVTKITILSAVRGLVIAAAVSFFASKLLMFIINEKKLRIFGIYDAAIGFIVLIIGIFEVVVK